MRLLCINYPATATEHQDLIDAHAAAAAEEVRELDCTPSEYEMTGRAEMDAFLAEQ